MGVDVWARVDVQAHQDVLREAVDTFYAAHGVPTVPGPVLCVQQDGHGTPGEYDWRSGTAIVNYRPTRAPALSALDDTEWEGEPFIDDFRGRQDDFIGVGIHEAWHAAFDHAHRVSGEKWQIYGDDAVEATIHRATQDYMEGITGEFDAWLEVRQERQPDGVYDRLYRMTRDRLHGWFGEDVADRYGRLACLRGIDEYVARTVAAWYGSGSEHPPRISWDARETLEYTSDHAAIHTVDGDALTGYIRDEGLQAVLDMEADALLDRFTRPI